MSSLDTNKAHLVVDFALKRSEPPDSDLIKNRELVTMGMWSFKKGHSSPFVPLFKLYCLSDGLPARCNKAAGIGSIIIAFRGMDSIGNMPRVVTLPESSLEHQENDRVWNSSTILVKTTSRNALNSIGIEHHNLIAGSYSIYVLCRSTCTRGSEVPCRTITFLLIRRGMGIVLYPLYTNFPSRKWCCYIPSHSFHKLLGIHRYPSSSKKYHIDF